MYPPFYSGICRNMPRDVVYSSTKYFGLGIFDPYFVQGVSKIVLFLKNGKDLTQNLIISAWHCLVMESGFGNDLFIKSPEIISKILHLTWMLT